MPPRAQPKIHQLQLKTHKLVIMLTVPPSTTVSALKDETLSALMADVREGVEDVPRVSGLQDFELCIPVARSTAGKGKARSGSSAAAIASGTGEYEVMDAEKQLRDYGLAAWDSLYLRFRDPESGELLPVKFTQPSIDDEEEDPMEADIPLSSASKGKRKARFDEE